VARAIEREREGEGVRDHIYIYIYIYREREREREPRVSIPVSVCTYGSLHMLSTDGTYSTVMNTNACRLRRGAFRDNNKVGSGRDIGGSDDGEWNHAPPELVYLNARTATPRSNGNKPTREWGERAGGTKQHMN
jgi:hypothetical protein